jgi:hypothetical protein
MSSYAHTFHLIRPALTTLSRHVLSARKLIERGDTRTVLDEKISRMTFRSQGRAPDFADDEIIALSHYMQQLDAMGLGLVTSQAVALLTRVKERKALVADSAAPVAPCTRRAVKALIRRAALLPDAATLFSFKPAALSLGRARSRRPDVLTHFVNKLDTLVADLKRDFGWTEIPPHRLYNIDEIGLDVEGKSHRVIGSRHGRHERIRSGERASKWMTALITCRADGDTSGEFGETNEHIIHIPNNFIPHSPSSRCS